MKNVSILGSTGSIGTQTLDVIRRNADINVVALAAGTRVSDLAEQVREFKPQLVCIGKEELVPELKTLIGDIDVKIENVQLEDALKHPNWAMGRKITIDSSTMVNKGLEVMEAQWLFGVPAEKVQVIVQPQSIIHSMVEFKDGAVMAQLGSPDMRLPIQYALYYPERRELNTERLDFYELANITFEKPDMETFKGLKLAYEAAARGGNIPTALNAATEVAVARFLDRKIKYLDIPDIIEYAMNEVDYINNPTVEQILSTQKIVTDMIESRW